jgi:predicted TPR repeat methyltransferase
MSTFYAASIEQLLAEAEALVQAQRHEEAVERARQVLMHQARNPRAHTVIAASLLLRDHHEEALRHVESALRGDRVNPRLHFMAALCLGPLGHVEDAIASYRRALQYRPEYLEARANLGYLLETAGRPAEAADCYRRVLAEQPREWFCLNRLGYCERILGKPAEGAGILERALALRPLAATANELALAYLNLDRKPEAIAMFRRAVELDPAFLAAWCNLAKVLYLEYVVAEGAGRKPDPAPVLDSFARVLALDPANVEFAYLRDCVAGVRADRPPDEYIAALFDRFAPRFDEKLVRELRYRGPELLADFMKAFLEARSALRVVDLGCGTGLSGEKVRGAARTLIGVDLSPAMLEQARARGIYDELVQGEIAGFLGGCEAGAFDLAVALEVFNYVGDLGAVLRAAAHALAAGGRMVFSIELAPAGGADFALLPAARYAHSTRYVEAAVRDAGFHLADSKEVTLREEAGAPVAGYLFALDKRP